MDSGSDLLPKKPNPVENANIISFLTFSYMIPIFKRAYKKGLHSITDLYRPLNEHESGNLGQKLEAIWKKEHEKNEKWALHLALFRIFGLQYSLVAFIKLAEEIILLSVVPLSIGRLTQYFEKNQTEISINDAYIAGSAIVIALLIEAFLLHPSMMVFAHLTMKLRLACSALVYRKTLRLSRAALGRTTVGHMVNLISNDVRKFEEGFVLSPYILIGPLETILGTYLLYREIGISAIGGIAFLISFLPLQLYLGQKLSILRLKTAIKTDERVRLMNEIISGIQVIKIYCWEKPFAKLVSFARRKEMKFIRTHAILVGIIYAFEMFLTRTSIFISLLTYVMLGEKIDAKKVFAITAVYMVLRPVLSILFSIGIYSVGEVHISVKRIQQFLSLEERKCDETKAIQNGTSSIPPSSITSKPKVVLENVSARWRDDLPEPTLKNININISSNELFAITGPVGAGKSSLFSVLLKELPIESGNLVIEGKISYASQDPWLFSGSVRQNILFGSEYDAERYNKIIEICALQTDLQLLPYGDKTLVGERGKALSGGQKARINLARCIYKEADIYLLDDPLSAVDANVGKHLYDVCIRDYLKNKITILITHQLQYVRSANIIIIMDDGEIKFQGPYSELQNSGLDYAKLMKSRQEEDEDTKNGIRSRQDSINEYVTDYEDTDEPTSEKEHMASGKVAWLVYWRYFRAGGGPFKIFLLVFMFLITQLFCNASDWYVSYWVNQEEDFVEENFNITNATFDRLPVIYTYAGITFGNIVLSLARTEFYMLFFVAASIRLHDKTFRNLIKASMRFFNHNPSGRILNRFSKDLGNADDYIVNVLIDVIDVALLLLGAIILSLMVNLWLIVPSIVLMMFFTFMRNVYMKTSRSVKRIEGIARSPILTHITASMHGLTTIRAFAAENALIKEFDQFQDNHSSAWYIFIASSRCFGFWLDMFCIIFTAAAIFFFLYFREGLYAGDIGLLLNQYLGLLGSIQWGMRQWSELENQMISVERILEYQSIEQEPIRSKSNTLPENWPEKGKIEFKNVSLKYNPEDPYVLKNLNFIIQPSEKIGIVGRTGAGKSSIISALFQLYQIEGSILIDEIDTTKLPLEDVRSKISIIPQEPILFSGTLRKNLDPFEEYSDETLWSALAKVELKELVQEMAAGLNSTVHEGGINLSVGQRQLICLARALIRNNNILVLDEATANVDPHTDFLIQNTIRREFTNCTVLTIAHRLHTVMDSDKILVMSAGEAVEFDHPHVLLEKEDSVFLKLLKNIGKVTSANLKTIARENYEKK